jgi:integrase
MREEGKLSALAVTKLRTPGRHSDGGGLYLQVTTNAKGEVTGKSWVFRYVRGTRPNRVEHKVGLGSLNTVNLQEARRRAREQRQLLADAHDPLAVKKDALAALKVTKLHTMTFREAAEQFLATDKVEQFKNDKHRQQWRSTLALSFPVIGDLPLQSIDSAVVLKALMPVWKRTPETGSRLRGRIERVLAWAKPLGLFVGENPASREVLKDHLPSYTKGHHAALPYADIPAFMTELRAKDSVSARALEFTILTAVRTQDTIGARWDEIDLDLATWTIPAARLKVKNKGDHRVPLSDRAVELLRHLATANGREGHVFINGGGKPLSNQAMSELLKGMVGDKATVHGFRSTFKDWAAETTEYPNWLSELAIAHVVKNKTEAAYRRGDALDKRRQLMADWDRYLG